MYSVYIMLILVIPPLGSTIRIQWTKGQFSTSRREHISGMIWQFGY